MAFVLEKIDSDEMDMLVKKLRPSTIMSMSAIQVIDREKDAVLIVLGGRGELPPSCCEPPDFYAIGWQESYINFECHEKWRRVENATNIELLMVALTVSKALQEREAEVKQLIKDALVCYFNDCTHFLGDVVIDFPVIRYY